MHQRHLLLFSFLVFGLFFADMAKVQQMIIVITPYRYVLMNGLRDLTTMQQLKYVISVVIGAVIIVVLNFRILFGLIF